MIPATTEVADGKENFLLQLDSKKPVPFNNDGHFNSPANANIKKKKTFGDRKKIRTHENLNKKASFLSDHEGEVNSTARQMTFGK